MTFAESKTVSEINFDHLDKMSSCSAKCILLSYHKNHLDFVVKVHSYLKKENFVVWIDNDNEIDQQTLFRYSTNIFRLNNENFSFSENDLIDKINVVVCFVTPMYQRSKHLQEQVQSAARKGIPVLVCYFLSNWKPSSK